MWSALERGFGEFALWWLLAWPCGHGRTDWAPPLGCCLFLMSRWPIWGSEVAGYKGHAVSLGTEPLFTLLLFLGHFGVVYHGEYTDGAQNQIHCAIKSLSRKRGIIGWVGRRVTCGCRSFVPARL